MSTKWQAMSNAHPSQLFSISSSCSGGFWYGQLSAKQQARHETLTGHGPPSVQLCRIRAQLEIFWRAAGWLRCCSP